MKGGGGFEVPLRGYFVSMSFAALRGAVLV